MIFPQYSLSNMPWHFYALLSVIFGTLFEITRKKALKDSHAMSFESLRSIFVVFLTLLFLPFMNFDISLNSLLLVYLTSIIATLGILYASKAYRHNDISLLSPLRNLKPGFVAILAMIFLSEELSYRKLLGLIILLIAAYLLESDHHFKDFFAPFKHLLNSRYSLYYIFAIFLFSITAIFDKYILSTSIKNIFTYFLLIRIFTALNFNLIHTALYGFKDSIDCLRQVTYLPFLVALFSILYNLLALKAITLTYVSLVTPVLMLSTLLVVLFGGRFFHEKYLLFRLTASIIMIFGALLIIL